MTPQQGVWRGPSDWQMLYNWRGKTNHILPFSYAVAFLKRNIWHYKCVINVLWMFTIYFNYGVLSETGAQCLFRMLQHFGVDSMRHSVRATACWNYPPMWRKCCLKDFHWRWCVRTSEWLHQSESDRLVLSTVLCVSQPSVCPLVIYGTSLYAQKHKLSKT